MYLRFYLALIILFVSMVVNSQPYQPLLETDNQWHFTTCYNCCLTDIYYTNSNTIVNGLPHKTLDRYRYNSRMFLLREKYGRK